MKILRIAIVVLIIAVGIMQLVPPEKNTSDKSSGNEITARNTVPEEVQTVLRRSCYDCHSNNTVYPWYENIQPVGWWLDNHIQEGKRHLNFDEFASYPLRRQYNRFRDISDQIEQNEMPLTSYLLIHRYAVLSADEKAEIIS